MKTLIFYGLLSSWLVIKRKRLSFPVIYVISQVLAQFILA